ncbi:alpha/beta-hydrolase [Zopfia rhizophila CBS 207.26]|uniref:Alpha/beta-hydrolase n=1 Tax=Zopfia rhizophila CBS 207.26 TaxID=1314779 RepID=A0A6A6ELI0_9PEZI|nr:alpha/beta-hydrolase [Zopfia rhizophila CBS 207.26]
MSTQQTAKTQYVAISDGVKLAYRRLGTGSGTPLVLLIHFRGTMDKWDPVLINGLAASRPIITVDYAGVGLSTGEVAMTIRQCADDVIRFLNIGGLVAQLIALNADPKALKVRKLILAGTGTSAGHGVANNPNTDMPEVGGRKEPDLSVFQVLFFPQNREGKAASETWWARIHERTPQACDEDVSQWLSWGFADQEKGLLAQSAQLTAFANPETSKGLDSAYGRLGEPKMPVLMANGKDDYMIPTSNSVLLQQKVPKGQLIIYPNSGHGFLFQYATLFAKHVLLFLEE